MNRCVLMVAYHLPPFKGSSGIQRTLRFMQYLPEFGWQPTVLAPHPRAYPSRGADAVGEIPATVPIKRAFALDIAAHVAIRGAYPTWMALPDRYNSWLLGAIPAGLRLVRRYRPQAIWTTYPVPTAHLIGYVLHKLTGLPWVADFRDPMVYEAWPEQPLLRRAHGWVERLVAAHAAKIVCVTPGAAQLYRARYTAARNGKVTLISNGYDEASFTGIRRAAVRPDGPLTLVHSGLLEPSDRDPTAFFEALAALRASGHISPAHIRVVLRGTGFDDRYRAQIAQLALGDIVTLEPAITYREALQEMVNADGLLLLQGPTCNRQIPAKAYEYIRAGRPIICIADPVGDTARLLAQVPHCRAAIFGDAESIRRTLAMFIASTGDERTAECGYANASRFERRALTGELASLLDELVTA